MEKTMCIADGIQYIGADDKELDLFEGQYVIPHGISYNSYVIIDEKVAVLDTIDSRCTQQWLANLKQALGDRQPDYLVVSHMEPDHAANVKRLLDMAPQAQVVCTAKAKQLITRFFGVELPAERTVVVKDGDTLSLGQHTLQFFTAPMVHWPEVMMEYEQTEKILFAADAFGKFGALDYDDPDGWACEARRYYFNIVGKYGAQVQAVLKKLSDVEIKTICPLHGPILKGDLTPYLSLYDTWSAYRPETEGVFIAYCSLHGNTEEAALKLTDMLRQHGGVKVSVSDLRRDDMAEAVEDAFRYDRMVLAAPTYDAGVMPVMEDFLLHLKMKNFQNRKVAFIENGSWAPVAAKKMREKIEEMKNMTIIEPVVTVESVVSSTTVEALQQLAEALVKA